MGATPPRQDVNSVLNRINQLGTATEKLFSRLYNGLRHQSQYTTPQQANIEVEKTRLIIERNKRLTNALRKRENEVQRLNAILANISEGIIMQDMDGRVILINPAARDLIGSQKNFWDTELGKLFDSSREITTVENELSPLGDPRSIQVNNRIIGTQLVAVADSHGNRFGTMLILRDVTRDALAERLKDQFITAISHELRTPMTVIKGASEVLNSLPADQPVNQRILDTLTRNVDTLDRMVVELLDISEMGAGSFTIRDDIIQLEPLLWSVVNSLQPDLKKAKLDIKFILRDLRQLNVKGDEQRLRWAFGHLLQNSIRYTERDGHLTVAVGLDEQNTQYIAIDVIDTGVGIAEKDLPHIFERFYRGEPRTPAGKLIDPRGLGQGLFVARTVAIAHGGYLSAHSVVGEGSVFTMILPKAQV